MFQPVIFETEVAYRQEQVRSQYIDSQRLVSIQGLREIIGNTFIQLGSSIHGKARAACKDAADSRALVREIHASASRVPVQGIH